MTVQELIDELSCYNRNAKVTFYVDHGYVESAKGVVKEWKELEPVDIISTVSKPYPVIRIGEKVAWHQQDTRDMGIG